MSTALNSFWLCSKSTGLMSGGDSIYGYADMLEQQFGPARALNIEGLDELFEAVERMLTGEDRLDTPPKGDTPGCDNPLDDSVEPV